MDTCNCQCVFNVVFLPCWMLTLQHKCCFSIVDYKVGTKRTFLSRTILSSLLSNPSSISYSMYPYLMEQLVQVAKKKKIRKIIVLISEQECKTWVLEILIHISDVCDLTCSDFLFNFHLWDLVFWLLLLSLYGKRADKALVSPLTDFWFWLFDHCTVPLPNIILSCMGKTKSGHLGFFFWYLSRFRNFLLPRK